MASATATTSEITTNREIAEAALQADHASMLIRQQVEVSQGDTLMGLLTSAGTSRKDAYQAIEALKEHFSPRSLRPGQEIGLAFSAMDPTRLASIELRPSVEWDIKVTRAGNEFAAFAVERPLAQQLVSVANRISHSLARSAADMSVPRSIMAEALRAFSFEVDFQRDVHKNDGFELIYETFLDKETKLEKTGRLLFASLDLSGKRIGLYRFENEDGKVGFYSSNGESARRALMRTPIDGARMSSGYGMRHHPVLGYSKMHRGVDFAAARGTPIYAAGDGVIEYAGRFSSYGNYIRIRHDGTYKTAYAHLHRLAKGVRKGRRVSQGEVIGYVGTTGRSTGPHLHYEILKGEKQINPLTIKQLAGKNLEGEALERFQQVRAKIDELRRKRPGRTQVAAAAPQ